MRNITFFQLGYFYNMCGSKKWVDTGARRRGSPICCEVMIMMIMMMMMMVMTMMMIMISRYHVILVAGLKANAE